MTVCHVNHSKTKTAQSVEQLFKGSATAVAMTAILLVGHTSVLAVPASNPLNAEAAGESGGNADDGADGTSTCRIPDDHKDASQTNADAKRTSLSGPSLGFCS